MSIRSRIEAFEALSKNEDSNQNKNESNSKKRFHFPGPRCSTEHSHNSQSNNHIPGSSNRVKTQGLADFESDLQEVWSVRKNVHHQGGTSKHPSSHQPATSSPLPSMQTAGHYSRHGAIPAQQSYGASVLPKIKDTTGKALTSEFAQNDDDFSFESKRSPLQEHNSKDTPWNVKKSNAYSYNTRDVTNKRPFGSPHYTNGVSSPPTAKRKPNIREPAVVRPTKATELMFPQPRRKPDDKVSYAKRMANGYLKSVGIGEYTPKMNKYGTNGPTHSEDSQKLSTSAATARWKKPNDDDFNFK